ncbi:hypothetical protein HYV73_01065 [Candidatus Uhrbacteria bacterium]|nr:hypothetical protein [Candidatus Uhrbacteria bacterium]
MARRLLDKLQPVSEVDNVPLISLQGMAGLDEGVFEEESHHVREDGFVEVWPQGLDMDPVFDARAAETSASIIECSERPNSGIPDPFKTKVDRIDGLRRIQVTGGNEPATEITECFSVETGCIERVEEAPIEIEAHEKPAGRKRIRIKDPALEKTLQIPGRGRDRKEMERWRCVEPVAHKQLQKIEDGGFLTFQKTEEREKYLSQMRRALGDLDVGKDNILSSSLLWVEPRILLTKQRMREKGVLSAIKEERDLDAILTQDLRFAGRDNAGTLLPHWFTVKISESASQQGTRSVYRPLTLLEGIWFAFQNSEGAGISSWGLRGAHGFILAASTHGGCPIVLGDQPLKNGKTTQNVYIYYVDTRRDWRPGLVTPMGRALIPSS